MAVFIGLDLGSSSARAAAFDEELRIVCWCQAHYPMAFPRPGWAEQDPQLILAGAMEALSGAAAKLAGMGLLESVEAIGVAGFMHSCMAVARDGAPLTTLLTWADQRTAPQVAEIAREYGKSELYRRTGCPVHTTYVAGKIRWLKANVPGLAGRGVKFMSAKEWVVSALTGARACDLGVASGSGLLNTGERQWDDLALSAAGVSPNELNPLEEPTAIIGKLQAAPAAATGLRQGIPVIIGSSDGAMSSLGCGAGGVSQVAAMIGTSGAIRMTSAAPMTDVEARCWCYYMAENRWIVGGATNNGGNVLGWLRGVLGGGGEREPLTYERLLQLAEQSPAGASGLLFLAFLAGERAPGWNASARGTLLGLTLSHTAADIARSVLEGTVFQLHGIYAALAELAGAPRRIVASGGFARSGLWLKILASVLETEIEVPDQVEGSAAGAAALAMIAAGYRQGLDWTSSVRRGARIISPDPADSLQYRRMLRTYYQAYHLLEPVFDDLANTAGAGTGPAEEERA